jgi:hypothetical protein
LKEFWESRPGLIQDDIRVARLRVASIENRRVRAAVKFVEGSLQLNPLFIVDSTAQEQWSSFPGAEPRSAMPFLDADALKSDPAGMALLRSVINAVPADDKSPGAAPGLAQRSRPAVSRSQRLRFSPGRERDARAKVRA